MTATELLLETLAPSDALYFRFENDRDWTNGVLLLAPTFEIDYCIVRDRADETVIRFVAHESLDTDEVYADTLSDLEADELYSPISRADALVFIQTEFAYLVRFIPQIV